MQPKNPLPALCLAFFAAISSLWPLAAMAAEVPKEIIAVQIRKQGYECKKPASAKRDGEAKADDSVWILACEGARYRVTLVPKMAAKVERLSENTSK